MEAHEHDASCYTSVLSKLVCGIEDEGHEHDEICYILTEELTCSLEEREGMCQYTEACYEIWAVLNRGKRGKEDVIFDGHGEDGFEDILTMMAM